MLKTYLPLTIACLVFGSSANAATLNLVTNGGFEIAEFQNGQFVFQGWNNPGGGFAPGSSRVNSGSFAASAVQRSRPAELSQTLATTVGTEYELSFFYDFKGLFIPNSQDIFFFSDAFDDIPGTLFNRIGLEGANRLGYINFTTKFTAASNPTELTFSSLLPRGILNIDDVSVTAVPVPFEFSPLLGTAIFGGLWFGKRLIKPKK